MPTERDLIWKPKWIVGLTICKLQTIWMYSTTCYRSEQLSVDKYITNPLTQPRATQPDKSWSILCIFLSRAHVLFAMQPFVPSSQPRVCQQTIWLNARFCFVSNVKHAPYIEWSRSAIKILTEKYISEFQVYHASANIWRIAVKKTYAHNSFWYGKILRMEKVACFARFHLEYA